MRGWSFADLTREVRANLVYREFTGIGAGKVPDDKTMGRLARQLGSEAIGKPHRRTVEIALANKVVEGRKMRVDTTVAETNIHYPTDSTLMGDGVRVLSRAMKRVAAEVGAAGDRLCSPQQERERSAEDEGRLRQAAGSDKPGGRAG